MNTTNNQIQPTIAQLMEWQIALNTGNPFIFHVEFSNGFYRAVFTRLWKIRDAVGHRERENFCFVISDDLSVFMEKVEKWMQQRSAIRFEEWKKHFEHFPTLLDETSSV